MNNAEFITKSYPKPPKIPKYGSLAKVVSEIKPGQKVLDVGCSEGYLASYLRGNQVRGLDGNVLAVEKARSTCVEAEVIDLNKLPKHQIFDQQFDVIIYADVLEHILLPSDVLVSLVINSQKY